MADTKNIIPDMIALLDQMQTQLENTAPVIGSYYTSLINNGIPEDLSAKLTISFCNKLWGMGFNQNEI